MVKFIHSGSRAQPFKMQNPSPSLKATPSTAIGNEELMHETVPNHSRMGTAKVGGKNSMGTVTENKKEHIYIQV